MKSCNTNKPSPSAPAQALKTLSPCRPPPPAEGQVGLHTPDTGPNLRRPAGGYLDGALRGSAAVGGGAAQHPRRHRPPHPAAGLHWRCCRRPGLLGAATFPPSLPPLSGQQETSAPPAPAAMAATATRPAHTERLGLSTARLRGPAAAGRSRLPQTSRPAEGRAPAWQMAGRPAGGGCPPHLDFLADAGRHGAGCSPPGPAMGSPQDRRSPSRRPPPPASAQDCSLPGPAAVPLPRRLHFEKSRRYPPHLPPRPRSRLRLTQSRPDGRAGRHRACAGRRPPVSLAAVTAHALLGVRRWLRRRLRRWRAGVSPRPGG